MAHNGEKKILAIDDERDLIASLQLRLESTGEWEVITAYDGADGLDKARQESPALILLDVVMPKMNGFQVCREIKADPALQHIPVILLTAKAQASDRFWGAEVKADAYITKPFDIDDLLEKMRALCNKQLGSTLNT